MPVQFDFSVFGPDKAAVEKVQKIMTEKLNDGIFLGMKRAAHIFKNQIRRNILTQGSASGVTWANPQNVDLAFAEGRVSKPWWERPRGGAGRPRIAPKGNPSQPMIHTWDYVNSWMVLSDRRNNFVRVAPGQPMEVHRPSGMLMQGLAEIFESGWFNQNAGRFVPARPHIGPAAESKQEDMVRIANFEIRKAANRAADILKAKRRLARVKARRR